MQHVEALDVDAVVEIFEHYLRNANLSISRAEFEKNLFYKKNDIVFNNDILPLLTLEQAQQYKIDQAYSILERFLVKLKGEPWKGESGNRVR
jgi:hypothetical protein